MSERPMVERVPRWKLWLEEALARRGRVWGERNAEQLTAAGKREVFGSGGWRVRRHWPEVDYCTNSQWW